MFNPTQQVIFAIADGWCPCTVCKLARHPVSPAEIQCGGKCAAIRR
jgi:hypothetical protein